MIDISICGADCTNCYCVSMCKGCNSCKGIVFHTAEKECAIYHCCVTEHGYKSCLDCSKLPCEIWNKTRDPKFSDEQFQTNIAERIERLKQKK